MLLQKTDKKIAVVGISGGVDSSVALALLKEKKYDVYGVFIRVWQPDWLSEYNTGCTWRDDRKDAQRVCATLGVPFIELDLEKEYKRDVADYMIKEYKKGHTPNPDVMCNKAIKFGGFYDWARARGADIVATGHYARTGILQKNSVLRQAQDISKDQTYFLWTLGSDQIHHTQFPLGDFEKTHVRKIAQSFHLPTQNKKDSQGICFLGKISMKDYLSHYIEEHQGDVIDTYGKKIGTHPGVLFFTLGERHGFNVANITTHDLPYFIVAKDIHANTLTVSNTASSLGEKQDYILENCNDPTNSLLENFECLVQIRYHGEMIPCRIVRREIIKHDENNNTSSEQSHMTNLRLEIKFDRNDIFVASGQSIVFYKDGFCIGGGICSIL